MLIGSSDLPQFLPTRRISRRPQFLLHLQLSPHQLRRHLDGAASVLLIDPVPGLHQGLAGRVGRRCEQVGLAHGVALDTGQHDPRLLVAIALPVNPVQGVVGDALEGPHFIKCNSLQFRCRTTGMDFVGAAFGKWP